MVSKQRADGPRWGEFDNLIDIDYLTKLRRTGEIKLKSSSQTLNTE